jgi:hypothetical protein
LKREDVREDREGIGKIKTKNNARNTEITLNHRRREDQDQKRIGKGRNQDPSNQ